MKDNCVLCGLPSRYDRETPVDQRENYVEGAGQVCDRCAAKAGTAGTGPRPADPIPPAQK